MSKVFDLWKEVGGAFGPSGREDAVRETIAGIAGAYIDDITTDALGNLICRKKGSGKKVLFAAHMDSIGVVATYIDENGFIRFSQIGGLYYADLVNITVRFANGTRGVISFEETASSCGRQAFWISPSPRKALMSWQSAAVAHPAWPTAF